MLAAVERDAFLANLAGYDIVARAKGKDTHEKSTSDQRIEAEKEPEQFKTTGVACRLGAGALFLRCGIPAVQRGR